MNHRKFVVTSAVTMLVVAGMVAGLAFYTNFAVRASVPKLPEALSYIPSDYQVVFGMNVKRFVASSVFEKFQAQHGQEIGQDLQEFITLTGVDPTRDVSYLLAAGHSVQGRKGSGAAIAIGNFNNEGIASYIKTKAVPIELDYEGVHVMMIPEQNGNRLEKGVAFISSSEVALGDLDSLKAIADVRAGRRPGIETNPVVGPLLQTMDDKQMFWFAGDAASILAKAPTNTPLGGSISSILNVVGTLNLDEAVVGRITATTKDLDSAQKLADVVRGFKALGQLAAGDQNPDISALLNGVTITQNDTKVGLDLNFSYDLLEKLQHARPKLPKI